MIDTHAGRAAAVFYASIKLAGPVLYHELTCAIGVLESADGNRSIVVALPSGGNMDGLALWILHVRGADVPGWYVIVDGAFVLEPTES